MTVGKATKRPRGRPFQPGNPGRKAGSRNRATLAAEALLDGEAEALTRKAIETALEGDTTALRIVLERILPVRKDRPITFDLAPLAGAGDHPAALASILAAMAAGDLTPTEAQAIAALLKEHRAAVETADLAERIDTLEQRLAQR